MLKTSGQVEGTRWRQLLVNVLGGNGVVLDQAACPIDAVLLTGKTRAPGGRSFTCGSLLGDCWMYRWETWQQGARKPLRALRPGPTVVPSSSSLSRQGRLGRSLASSARAMWWNP